MTAIQLNAELYRNMGIIADDEVLMKKVLKYVKRLAATKEDSTLMSQTEFFARVDEAKKQIRDGKGEKMLPNETLDQFLERVG